MDTFISEAVFIFDKDGKFVKKLALQGEGPNEYIRPMDIVVEEEKVWILDNGRTIKIFIFSGNKVDEIDLTTFSAIKSESLKEAKVFAFISGDIDDNLIIADKIGGKIGSYFPYLSRRVDRVIINPIFKNYSDDKIIYRREFNDTLYAINSEGLLNPYKHMNFGGYTLGKEFDVDNLSDENLKNIH